MTMLLVILMTMLLVIPTIMLSGYTYIFLFHIHKSIYGFGYKLKKKTYFLKKISFINSLKYSTFFLSYFNYFSQLSKIILADSPLSNLLIFFIFLSIKFLSAILVVNISF